MNLNRNGWADPIIKVNSLELTFLQCVNFEISYDLIIFFWIYWDFLWWQRKYRWIGWHSDGINMIYVMSGWVDMKAGEENDTSIKLFMDWIYLIERSSVLVLQGFYVRILCVWLRNTRGEWEFFGGSANGMNFNKRNGWFHMYYRYSDLFECILESHFISTTWTNRKHHC